VRGRSVTRRYAKALLDLVDDASAEATRSAVESLSQLIAAVPALKHLLGSPAFTLDEKLAVLSSLTARLHSPPILNRFLSHLVTRNRITLLPEIAESFESLLDEAKGRRKVQITSAMQLSSEDQSHLRARLKSILRRDVDLDFASNPGLLAGVQIRIDSTVYDSTARSRLLGIQSLLTKE
jgi:F-type H+-transporting ATPase subunit delta